MILFLVVPNYYNDGYPPRLILTHPEVTSRLIKWATKLSEYNIEYRLAHLSRHRHWWIFWWRLYTRKSGILGFFFVDRSSTNEGNGVRVVLIFLQKEEIKLAIWLHFWASKNEMEYDILLKSL